MSETREGLQRQYRDSGNLGARGRLYERFATNPQSWFEWVFDRCTFPSGPSVILEVGCGPGRLWGANRHRLKPSWRLFLTDLSPGMIVEAFGLLGWDDRFKFAVTDVQALPLGEAAVDFVVANHMLYHAPDLARAIGEIYRVLRPGGSLYAATNGRAHLREFGELVLRFDPGLSRWSADREKRFALENGAEALRPWFADVKLFRFEDQLVVPEAGALVDYVFSMAPPRSPGPDRRAEFTAFIQHELDRGGPIRITRDTGLFAAIRT